QEKRNVLTTGVIRALLKTRNCMAHSLPALGAFWANLSEYQPNGYCRLDPRSQINEAMNNVDRFFSNVGIRVREGQPILGRGYLGCERRHREGLLTTKPYNLP